MVSKDLTTKAAMTYCHPGLGRYEIGRRGGYDVVLKSLGDLAEFDYHNTVTGALVALVGIGNTGPNCIAGSPEFVVPDCSPSTSLCTD